MTDIIKNFDEKESGRVATYLRGNRAFEESNIKLFREELFDLGVAHPGIVAFGNDAYSILQRHFRSEYRLLKIPHYANYSSKEEYRDQVTSIRLS